MGRKQLIDIGVIRQLVQDQIDSNARSLDDRFPAEDRRVCIDALVIGDRLSGFHSSHIITELAE
jgi:hypothetical protein